MEFGYDLYINRNELDNIKAVRNIFDIFGFTYNERFSRFLLPRLWDDVFIFCKRDRIIINVLFHNRIEKKYVSEAAMTVLKLNYKFNLNLGIDGENLTADYTFYTPCEGCNTDAFDDHFYKHMNNIDDNYKEIMDALDPYWKRAFNISDDDLLNIKNITAVIPEAELSAYDIELDEIESSDNDFKPFEDFAQWVELLDEIVDEDQC